jgi:hypothetical protein
MRRALLTALAGLIAVGMAGSAGAATLSFTGTLRLHLATIPAFVVSGSGSAQVSDDGNLHLSSLLLPGGTFGPTSTIIPITAASELPSVRLTLTKNLSGSFAGISGGPPGGGSMGLEGVAKICLPFGPDCSTNVSVPLTPTTGGAGFGIGGTVTTTGGAVDVTMQHAAWTIGQPTTTFHTPNTNAWTPTLPGGFAHGPASVTSSTAQPSGVLHLVTVSKVFTSLTSAFPELPVYAELNLHFVPEPGAILLFATGTAVLAVYARFGRRR